MVPDLKGILSDHIFAMSMVDSFSKEWGIVNRYNISVLEIDIAFSAEMGSRVGMTQSKQVILTKTHGYG